MGRRDVWLDTAEQARGAVRLLIMCDQLSQTQAVRALTQINLIGDRPNQLDVLVMDLVREKGGVKAPEPFDDLEGFDLL